MHWSVAEHQHDSTESQSAIASLVFGFPEVDWRELQDVYGWAALQWQAWSRGYFTVEKAGTYLIHANGLLEYWVDDHHFGGDLYSFRRAPAVRYLEAGTHRVDVRLVRDVRAMGAILPPTLAVSIEITLAGSTKVAPGALLLADVVDGQLVSSRASIILTNTGKTRRRITSVDSATVGTPLCLLVSEM